MQMVEEFNLVVLDGNRPPSVQQREVRAIIGERIDLAQYRWETPPVRSLIV
jgi:hypothetical protein